RAGSLFGTEALLHLIADKAAEDAFRYITPKQAADGDLPPNSVNGLWPVVLAGSEPSEVMEIEPLEANDYPLIGEPFSDASRAIKVKIKDHCLMDKIEQALDQSQAIVTHFMKELAKEEAHENFRSLYRLRPAYIREVRQTRLGVDPARSRQDMEWLQRLPKADLHCHLGGVLDSAGLVRVARAALTEADQETLAHLERTVDSKYEFLFDAVSERVESKKEFKNTLIEIAEETGLTAHLLLAAFISWFSGRLEELDRLVFGPYLDESKYIGLKIKSYERLGDIQGSALLQSRAAIAEACRVLYEQACRDNVRYLEVRCSPKNYTAGGLDFGEVVKTIKQAFGQEMEHSKNLGLKPCQVGLILIATRHKTEEEIKEHICYGIQETSSDLGEYPIRVVGFDLAGDEATKRPEELRDCFMPVFENCLHVTIHAGETEPVTSIWEAVYHLSADRVGHGLKLADDPRLLSRIRDRGITVELCPSSNFQIVGFKDSWLDQTHDLPLYPLRQYLSEGLEVCLNTDNPGISRTSLSQEYLKAARMTEGGLSKWEILSLVKLGFKNAFIPRNELSDLLKEVDAEVFQILAGQPA
ncbi:MAG: hypothetical protein V1742_01600, partial [Pseudomonadota bacterium]